MGAVEVQSLGYYTLVLVSCDSVRVDAKLTSSFETENVWLIFPRGAFLYLGEGTGHGNNDGTLSDTT